VYIGSKPEAAIPKLTVASLKLGLRLHSNIAMQPSNGMLPYQATDKPVGPSHPHIKRVQPVPGE
jgi:hypothetical protein